MTLFDIHTGLCSSFGFILNSISYAKWKSPHCTAKYLIPAGTQYFSSTAEQKIIYMHLIFCVCVNFLNFLSPLLLFSLFSFSLTSSSQVSIHHHAGGHLSSDSFVNVNYCSLSGVVSAHGEQYLQGCPSPTRMCKNPEQPAYRFTFFFFWTCPSLLHLFTLEFSGYSCARCYFIDPNPLRLTQNDVFWRKAGEMLSGYVSVWPKIATTLGINKVVRRFDFLHYMNDLVTYFPYGTLFTRWFLHLEIWPISCFKWAPSGFIY